MTKENKKEGGRYGRKAIIAVQREVKESVIIQIDAQNLKKGKLAELASKLQEMGIEFKTVTKQYGDDFRVVAFPGFVKMWETFGAATGVPLRPLQNALRYNENDFTPAVFPFIKDGVETTFVRFYIMQNAEWDFSEGTWDSGKIRYEQKTRMKITHNRPSAK